MVNFHYLKRYNRIITHYKQNITDGFLEKHHILPKCMGGSNEIENLVVLPARAHFICHYLLHKSYPENIKLAHAFAMMIVNNPYQKRTSRLYEKAKIARTLALKGIARPEWVKQKLRKPKSSKENYKKSKSELHKQNISNALKGKKHHWQKKVTSSEGYIFYQNMRKKNKLEQVDFHRKNFIQLNIKRKEYYKLFPEINYSTLKGYLRGL